MKICVNGIEIETILYPNIPNFFDDDISQSLTDSNATGLLSISTPRSDVGSQPEAEMTNPMDVEQTISDDNFFDFNDFDDVDDTKESQTKIPLQYLGSHLLESDILEEMPTPSADTTATHIARGGSFEFDFRSTDDHMLIIPEQDLVAESNDFESRYQDEVIVNQLLNREYHLDFLKLNPHITELDLLVDPYSPPHELIASLPSLPDTPKENENKKRSFDNMEQKPTQQTLRITNAPETKENQYLALMNAYRVELLRMHHQTLGKNSALSNQANKVVDEMDRIDRQHNEQSAKLIPKTQDHRIKENRKILSLLAIDESLAPAIAWSLAIPAQILQSRAKDAKIALNLDMCGIFTAERLDELNAKRSSWNLDAHPPQEVCDSFTAQYRLFDDSAVGPNTRRRMTLNGNTKQ